MGIQLGHAGRKSSTQLGWQRMDEKRPGGMGLASMLTSFAAPHGAFSPFGTAGAEWDGAPKAAMAKMVATENAQRVIDRAVQRHGGQGVRKGSMVECLYREIRALRVYVGATEVQRLNIGKGLLGD